jgi:NitT/TauT family transport system substrate-binding protein
LNGQTVSCAAVRDTSWLASRAFIDGAGGDSSTVKFIELPFSAVEAALQEGRIQAGVTVEPFLSSGVKAGKIRSLGDFLGAISPRLVQTAYVARREYLGQNRAALQRFARVVRTANEYMNTHRADFAALTETFTGVPRASQTPEATLFSTETDLREYQPWIDVSVKYGTLPTRVLAAEIVQPV